MHDTEAFRQEAESTASRRAFLLGAAGVTGVAVAAATWKPTPALAASDGRSYVTGYFALKLDGVDCGLVQKFEGGGITADVITSTDQSGAPHKHIGQPKYEDIAIALSAAPSDLVASWIDDVRQGKNIRKAATIAVADTNRSIGRLHEFHDVLLTEIGFPGTDASSKDAQKLTLKFTPEATRFAKGSGKLEPNAGDANSGKWFTPSNFKLSIGGLEEASYKVSKIDAITIKQTVITNATGERRSYLKEPGKLEFPNLKITISEQYAQAFYDWHEDFVVNGNNGPENERTGSLIYYDNDGTTPLVTLTFQNLGIFAAAVDGESSDKDHKGSLTVEMYMQSMTAKFGPPQPPPVYQESASKDSSTKRK